MHGEAEHASLGREVDPFELELVVMADGLDGVAEQLRLPEARRGRDPVARTQLGAGAGSQAEHEHAVAGGEIELLPRALDDRRLHPCALAAADLLRGGCSESAVGQLPRADGDERAEAELAEGLRGPDRADGPVRGGGDDRLALGALGDHHALKGAGVRGRGQDEPGHGHGKDENSFHFGFLLECRPGGRNAGCRWLGRQRLGGNHRSFHRLRRAWLAELPSCGSPRSSEPRSGLSA